MMRAPMIFGAVLVLVGLLGLAVPVFSTQHTENVAKLGDLKIQTTERHWYSVPPLLSGGAVVLGIVLIGAGAYKKR